MLALKNLLMAGSVGMMIVALYILAHDLYRGVLYRRALATAEAVAVPVVLRWQGIAGTGDAGMGTALDGVQPLWWCPAAWRGSGYAR